MVFFIIIIWVNKTKTERKKKQSIVRDSVHYFILCFCKILSSPWRPKQILRPVSDCTSEARTYIVNVQRIILDIYI